jgi:hypothetical protein
MADFACLPNLPLPKRYVQAGKFFGRRGIRLSAGKAGIAELK